ncbi:importin-4-like [Ornithodoros turicata]|uniref:importin-4-like n=1 Tax=Ornithodoros turicata TaxID=34597 RepID=UPI00313881C2
MAAFLEDILCRLLVPDNAVIVQATRELQEAYKDPNIVEHLYNALCMSQNAQVRQYSAVLLRKKVLKSKVWKKLPVETRTILKANILQRLTIEKEKPVLTALGQLVATIAKNECQSSAQWSELQQFLNITTHSKNVEECQLGFYMVSLVASVAPEMFAPHLKPLFNLFGTCLQSTSDQEVCFRVIKSMTALVNSLGSDEVNCFQALIPVAMEVIKKLGEVDEDKATEAMELFDELIGSEIAILLPHIKPLVKLCIDVARNRKFGNLFRVRSMCLLSWLISIKKKTIIKHKLIPELLEILFPIMSEVSQDGELEDDEDDADENRSSQLPSACAAQVIDVMALHLPPEKLLPPLIQLIEKYLVSNDPFHKKAAYLAIAVVAEGCSEAIRQKHMQAFLHIICQGIRDPDLHVKNSALFALGQFADYLQPDIGKYASDVLPMLFNYLSETAEHLKLKGKNPPSLSKTFYALETFCETLEHDLVPYLPSLMEQLFAFLDSPTHRAKELAVSAIGAAANATKEAMLPYFAQILQKLEKYLTEQQSEQDSVIRTQAIDTLGCLARTIGNENFRPMATECVQLSMRLIDAVDDPDLRRSTYGLLASLSSVLKEDMAPYMERIVEHMFNSLKSTEGVVTHVDEGCGPAFPQFDDLEESEDDETSLETESDGDNCDEDGQGFSVENAYVDEKEDTCVALREIASNMGLPFEPYLEKAFTEVLAMTDYPNADVQKAAFSALGEFTILLFQCATKAGSAERVQDVRKAISILLPNLINTCRTEVERELVIAAFDVLASLIKELKGLALEGTEHMQSIVNLIKDAFHNKLACQDEGSDDENDDDKEEAEFDEVLIESAGDLVPALAKAVPPEKFAPYLAGLLPLFLAKLKKQSSSSEKSYAVGILAETVEGLGKAGVGPFCQPLLPVFLNSMRDKDAEVRSNSVFGLGVLAENAGDVLKTQYPAILEALSAMLSREDNRRAKDNICGAVARLILTNIGAVPMAEVFPVFLQQLPLEEDTAENTAVFRCLSYVYEVGHEQFLTNLHQILRIVLGVINTDSVTEDTRAVLVHLIKSMGAQIPLEVQAVLQSLTPVEQELFNAALTSS